MSDQQGPQFIVRDIDENHDDVPVDNFIWKDRPVSPYRGDKCSL